MAQGHTTQERQGWQEESHLLDHRGVEGVQAAVKSHALKANKVGHLHPGRSYKGSACRHPGQSRGEQGPGAGEVGGAQVRVGGSEKSEGDVGNRRVSGHPG